MPNQNGYTIAGPFAETLIDATSDALFVVAPDGRIRSWNRGSRDLFGYSSDEAIGQPLESLVASDRRAEIRASLERVLQIESLAFETLGLHKDGSPAALDLSMRGLTSDGERFIAVAARDVTELHRLRAAEKRRVADRATAGILTNLSHELRTPLNAIIGFTNLLHKGNAGPLSPEQREYLGDVLSSSEHLLLLINDILDLAKAESGTMEVRPQHVDLARLLDEVRHVLGGLVATRRLTIDMTVHPDAMTAVVDPARVKQILFNYLSNSIKFTPDGGTIQVRVLPEGPAWFRVEVEDSGVGIASRDLDRLFVEFQQLDAGVGRKHQGVGLGLALTKRLAEAHGGRVAVRSQPGSGSTFAAILPRAPGVSAGDPAAAPARPPDPGPAIRGPK
jgi:PAS domain S-box-containing protein